MLGGWHKKLGGISKYGAEKVLSRFLQKKDSSASYLPL